MGVWWSRSQKSVSQIGEEMSPAPFQSSAGSSIDRNPLHRKTMHSICGREYATGLLLLLALASLSVVSNVRALTADLYRRPLQDKAARSGLPDHLANCASLRWDAVYPLGSTGSPASSRDVPLFHPACADPLPGAKPARQATVELPFELKDFRCTNTTQDVCDMGRATIERAGLRIAKAIKFKQPVYVQVNLTSFCRNATYCSLEEQNGIGGASPASFIEGVFDNAKDEPVSIPAALWKQIYNGPAIAMAPYDITSRFNVIYDFHFVEEGTILPVSFLSRGYCVAPCPPKDSTIRFPLTPT